MSDLLLVESLDKDWEDSDSEQPSIDETDPLEVAVKDEDSKDDIKQELVEDPLAEKQTELSNRESSISPIENVNCESHVEICTEPASNLLEIADNDGNSNFTVVESNVLAGSVNLSVGETQNFIMQVTADEITLTPDHGFSAPSAIAETVDRDDIADKPDSTKKQPQISLKRRKIIKPICQGERRVRKNASGNSAKKSDLENQSNVPSVYSYSEIKRHKERLTLKALQDDSSSDSDSKSSEASFDPDLDVNLRIIEGSNQTAKENVIIGEIHCDVPAEDENSVDVNSQKSNKNTVFKLSVNADFSEKAESEQVSYTRINDMPNIQIHDESDERMNRIFINDDEDADDLTDEDINGLSSLYDDDFFSENDSDLEILTSKSISRKRTSVPFVRKERPTDSSKRTMYDLIYDTVTPAPRIKKSDAAKSDAAKSDATQSDATKSDAAKTKTEPKKRAPRKPKANATPKRGKKGSKKEGNAEETVTSNNEKPAEPETSNSEKTAEELDSSSKDVAEKDSNEVKDEMNDALPVPQLKVNADGEVIIDTDSLMIEQTGVAAARKAIANSEVVEETGLSYRSYSKKNNFRRQWSPHDTLKFYDVLSVVGTDFTLMATLFPGRTRNCIKRKYKKEEKTNRDLITKALTCKQKFNIGLLEKELKLKEERVNLLKQNSKKEKQEKTRKKKDETAKVVKPRAPSKRKSFFERGISCFQDT